MIVSPLVFTRRHGHDYEQLLFQQLNGIAKCTRQFCFKNESKIKSKKMMTNFFKFTTKSSQFRLSNTRIATNPCHLIEVLQRTFEHMLTVALRFDGANVYDKCLSANIHETKMYVIRQAINFFSPR